MVVAQTVLQWRDCLALVLIKGLQGDREVNLLRWLILPTGATNRPPFFWMTREEIRCKELTRLRVSFRLVRFTDREI